MSARATPLTRSDFKLFREIPTRWLDVDIYGHVNNVVYLSYFDTAVNGWYIDAGILNPQQSENVFLVVETSCQYFSEITFPQVVTAGIRIEKLGNSSIRYTIGLFKDDESHASAQGAFVHVQVDRKTRRPLAIEAEARSLLQAAEIA